MRNQFETTVKLTRGEICDLLIACLAAEQISNNGEKAKKWDLLHSKLKFQLDELDEQLDKLYFEWTR